MNINPDTWIIPKLAWGRETQRVHVWELAEIRAELRAHGLDW